MNQRQRWCRLPPRITATFTQLNFLLGTGPVIVPMVFFQAGFMFSTIWTIIVWAINFITATYIGQAMITVDKQMLRRYKKPELIPPDLYSQVQNDGFQQVQHPQRIRTYDHDQLFWAFYGKKWKKFPKVCIIIYLFGSTISRVILTGQNLTNIFEVISYQIWLALFFLSGAFFSFQSIEKTKHFQTVILIIRIFSILLMIIGAFIIIVQNQVAQDLAPTGGNAYFNGQFFSPVFSNLIFAFMFNHSLPGMTKQLKKKSDIFYFISRGHVIALFFMLIIPITACVAFGNGLTGTNPINGRYQLVYYNENFNERIDAIYYIISLYIFLNIATFSVSIITLRRNVLALIAPDVESDILTKSTAGTTGILLIIILVIAFLLGDYIQPALNFTGVLAMILLFILPSMEVIGARKLPCMRRYPRSSYKFWGPYVMIVLGIAGMGFNMYQTLFDVFQ